MMPNAILYKNGSDEITYFVEDCIKKGNDFIGSNCKLMGMKPVHWSVKWTTEILEPIKDSSGSILGWNKKVSEVTESSEATEITQTNRDDFMAAVKVRKELAALTYGELNEYIDTKVVDLPSAKQYLQKLSRVVLAMIRIMDKEEG